MSRRVLVTGASRGIGAAVATTLAQAGHRVAGSARDLADLQAVSSAIPAEVGEILPLPADIGDLAQAAALPEWARELLGGPVEIFVHCAGISRPAAVRSQSLADWELVLRVNLTSAMLISQRLVGPMTDARWGRLVMIGSLYSKTGGKHAAAYTASKHGLLGLARTLAAEYASKGITCNVVIPGWTRTEMVSQEAESVAAARGITTEQATRLFLRNQPIGRMIEPTEVAALVAFLVAPDSGAITGQSVHIDGGSWPD